MDMVAKATFRPSIHPDSQSVAGAAVDRIQRALDAEDGEVTLPAGFQRASELGSPPKPPVDVVHEADGDSEGEESEPTSSWQSFEEEPDAAGPLAKAYHRIRKLNKLADDRLLTLLVAKRDLGITRAALARLSRRSATQIRGESEWTS
jgi:hypothetical protein